jgi:PAS domain S-box-containing protein
VFSDFFHDLIPSLSWRIIVMNSLFGSIRTQLLLLVLISVLPALGIVLYSGLTIQNKDIQRAENDAMRVVHTLAYDHERIVESTRQLLIALARFPDVQNQDAKACNRLFAELLKENPIYANIFSATAEGMVFSNARPFKPHSIKERKYYQDVLRTMDFSVGEYVIGVTMKQPVLHFAYPVRSAGGGFKGIIVVAFDLNRYGHLFPMGGLSPGSRLTLSDHKNKALYRHPDPESHIGKVDNPEIIRLMTAQPNEGIFLGLGNDGIKCLYGYKRFYLKGETSPYLFLSVGIPEEQALSYARNALVVNLLLLGGALLIALVLAWFLGGQLIVQRLSRLMHAAQRLGRGDLQVRTGLNHSPDELGLLTKAFDDMAGELEGKEAQRKSAEKALRESEAQLLAILDATPFPIALVDVEDNNIGFWSRSALTLFGHTAPTASEWFQMAYPDPDYQRDVIDRWKPALEKARLAAQAVNAGVYRVSCSDGSVRICELYAAFLADRLIVTFNDITERKQAEDEIRKLNAELEQRVAARTAELAERTRQMETFTYSVSHDLKAPLRGIDGYSRLLLEDYSGRLDEEGRTFLTTIRQATDQMRQLIEDLLAYSRMERRSLASSKVHPLALVQTLLVERSEDIHACGISVTLNMPDVVVKADPDGLAQVLRNLLDNALKFTGKTPDPQIAIGGQEKEKTCILWVRDNGIGFDMRYHDRIFEIFQRLHPIEDYPGTGIGMAIVLKAMERMGGRVWAESAPGKGATFYLEVPK